MNDKETTIVVELLKRIHKFYPIGLPHLNSIYPGYRDLLSITENKINNLIEKKIDTWDDMAKSFESKLIYTIRDESFLQFPNRSFRIEFDENEYLGLIIKKNIHLYISLLHNSYTYFIKHDFIINEKQKFSLLSTQQTESDLELLALLKGL